jgi:hypothetical protein
MAAAWRVTRERSPIDDRENIYISRFADDPDRRWVAGQTPPSMHFRCQGSRFEGFVATGAVGSYYGSRIRLRFDDDQPITQTWSNGANYSSVFMPDPRAFARAAVAHAVLAFEITTDRLGPQATIFRLGGLREALQPILDACRISIDPPAQPRAAATPAASAPSANRPTTTSGPTPDEVRARIAERIRSFWNPPGTVGVDVHIDAAADGAVRDVRVTDQARYRSDASYRAAADAAVCAVRRASPLPIPRDQSEWFRSFDLRIEPPPGQPVRLGR